MYLITDTYLRMLRTELQSTTLHMPDWLLAPHTGPIKTLCRCFENYTEAPGTTHQKHAGTGGLNFQLGQLLTETKLTFLIGCKYGPKYHNKVTHCT